MTERVALGALFLTCVGLAVVHLGHLLAVDIVGGILVVVGALTELLVTIYSVATRGLFGRRDGER